MDFAFNDEQEMIRTPAADFLKNECPADLVRELMESGHGHSEDLWEKIIELGWSALPFPAEYGGLDLTFVDLAIILEEMGKVLLPGTYFSTVVLGGLTLLASGSEEQKRQWLEPLAEGSLKATLAVAEPAGRIDAAGVTLKADRQGDSYSLSGTKLFVPDAHTADLIICAARTGDSADPSQGISLLAVDRDSVGLGVKPLQTLDQTRRLYEVTFDGVQLTESRILGEAGQAWAVLETVLDKAAIGLSAEMVGGAQRMLDLSVAYSKERVQFGRPIGSFQAIQHKCADMLIYTEGARSAVYAAAWAASQESEDLAVQTSIAKAYTSDAFRFVAGEGIQIHGGMGFTWEEDPHLYLKRAKSAEVALGDATYHRERIATLIGL